MTREEIVIKLKSVKLCLEAHPDNEIDSEFEDRIDDLNEIITTLQVVENNNGWIKIESEEDLPKGGDIYYRCGKMFDNGKFVVDDMFTYNYIDKDKFTHYQPIEKQKPPIY